MQGNTIGLYTVPATSPGLSDVTFTAAAPAVPDVLIMGVVDALLSNFPSAFNPGTCLPYGLAESADVTVRNYSAQGKLVWTLSLGHQPAGLYLQRSRAAYWDGRNAAGEPVTSGVYFYTLTAGEFAAICKMLIRK